MNSKKPRVFLISYHTQVNIGVAEKLVASGIQILYWTHRGRMGYIKEVIAKKHEFRQTIFHDADEHDILRAAPAKGIDTSNFAPADKKLIERLLKCESLFWMMADRFEDRSELSLRQIKHKYYEYVKYWYGVLKQLKPDCIIFGTSIPHVVCNFVIYTLAKMLGIKTIVYSRTNGILPERLLFFTDYQDQSELRKEYKRLQQNNFSFNDLSQGMQDYYRQQADESIDSTPFYQEKKYISRMAQKNTLLPSLSSIIKNIKNLSLFKTSFKYIQGLLRKKRIFGIGQKLDHYRLQLKLKQYKGRKKLMQYAQDYLRLQKQPDYSKKFIYVPLHYQPEASTSPLGDVYDDQLLMIDNLSTFLPDGWKIFVKENLVQWQRHYGYMGRYYNYYQQLAKIKNVRLIPAEISSHELIGKAQAVATATGTAAWEAVLRSVPALVFGYPWFMDCEGIFKINDLGACKAALKKISDGYIPDQKKVIQFLGAIEKISFKGFVFDKFANRADVNQEEAINNISNKLIKMIKS